MSEFKFNPIIPPSLPEKPRLPEAEAMEAKIFDERPDLVTTKEQLETMLDADRFDTERFNRWIETWNKKEAARGFEGAAMELSGSTSKQLRHGRLKFYYYQLTGSVKIGFSVAS